MPYYGLRASEIAGLTLDAVNWKTASRCASTSARHARPSFFPCQTRRSHPRPISRQSASLHPGNNLPVPQGVQPYRSHDELGGMRPIHQAGAGKRTAARRCLLLCTTPLFAMRLLGRGRWRENDRRPAWPSLSLESTCVYLRIETDMLRNRWLYPCPAAPHIEEDGRDRNHLSNASGSPNCGMACSSTSPGPPMLILKRVLNSLREVHQPDSGAGPRLDKLDGWCATFPHLASNTMLCRQRVVRKFLPSSAAQGARLLRARSLYFARHEPHRRPVIVEPEQQPEC